MRLTTSRRFAHWHVPRSSLHQTQARPADWCFNSWIVPRNRLHSGRFLHKPRSAMQPCFQYLTTVAMSPAPLNSPSDEQPPHAVAVYCGASPGTEAAFHHAAVCKNTTLHFVVAFFGDLRKKLVSFSSGARSRHGWSAACVWRR